jgi:glycosyltransferase involved in cell wall biosynthesis
MLNKFHISIIIPCYNDGVYLKETVEKILAYNGKLSIQCIIVDDGSSDLETLSILGDIKENEKVEVYCQENKKMSSARNFGAFHATAEYLLFLDSDDFINFKFLENAFDVLEKLKHISIVYGNSTYFGEKNGVFINNFDRISQFYVNGLNISALIRKNVWEKAGGFDESMTCGYEDWDFWIQVLKADFKFFKLEEEALKYRIKKTSTNTLAMNKHQELLNFIQRKNIEFFNKQYIELHREVKDIKNNRRRLVKYLFRNLLGKKNE